MGHIKKDCRPPLWFKITITQILKCQTVKDLIIKVWEFKHHRSHGEMESEFFSHMQLLQLGQSTGYDASKNIALSSRKNGVD